MQMQIIGTLTPRPPYNFSLVLEVLARYAHPFTDRVHAGAYWRVLRLGDDPAGRLALIRVDGVEGLLHVAALAEQRDHPAVLAALHHVFGLDDDFSAFYTYAQSDADLWAVVAPLLGLRWPRTASVFEALMITIVEQQIAWTAAQKALRWLVEWGGDGLHYEGRMYYAFPTAQQIAAATVETLTPLKITFRRMRLMIDIAAQVTSGALHLEAIRTLPYEQAYAALTAIKGVGHWTACWTLTRSLGALHNYVGHNDVALQAAVNRYFYGGVGQKSAEQTQQTFARYGQFAGIAAHYTVLSWVLEKYPSESTGRR